MKKYKVLKEKRYAPRGIEVIALKPGDEVELSDFFGPAFVEQGFCELCEGGKPKAKKVEPTPEVEKEEVKKDDEEKEDKPAPKKRGRKPKSE